MLRIAMLICLTGLQSIALAVGPTEVTLRDNASVSGAILAEKPDQLVLDLGFTVLVIPRDQILEVRAAMDNASSESPIPPEDSVIQSENGLYQMSLNPPQMGQVRELAQELGGSVVQVRTPGGLGSGFIIHPSGFLMTNFHVIENETRISVEIFRRSQGRMERENYKDVRIVAINKFADLALLKIDDAGSPEFKPVNLGSSDAMLVGDRVFAIGSPLGLERTLTEGILSTKTRHMQGELYLQTTTQINPGNSGGPLFNMRGEVIGVTNMKMNFAEGLGFAIPVETVKYFLDHRDAFAYDNDNPSNAYHYLEPPGAPSQSEASQGSASNLEQ